MYLNHNLKWDHHIDQVTAKAARKLGFIRRNLRGAPAECKKLAYIALVRSGLEYASIIWDPHTNTNSDKLEKIQRSAARWVLSSYSRTTSVTSLLEQLKLEPLQTRRRIQRLAFMYKILNGQLAVPMADLDFKFTKRPIRGKDTNTKRLETLMSSTNEYKFSVTTRTIKEWNAIPQSVVSAGPCRLTARSRSDPERSLQPYLPVRAIFVLFLYRYSVYRPKLRSLWHILCTTRRHIGYLQWFTHAYHKLICDRVTNTRARFSYV